ncbi:alkaline phosphatase family protein [bacterium]|nr:alkaline phosphatase family protein [bacterium]
MVKRVWIRFIMAIAVLLVQGCSESGLKVSLVESTESIPAMPQVTLEEATLRAKSNTERVCFIGVDALTWDILNPMLDNGELPNFRKLIAGGSKGTFDSADDRLFSPRIWTTMATGKIPEKHGILFFLIDPIQAQNTGKTAGSDLRNCLAVWNILSFFNRSIHVSNYMVTWPAEKITGTRISDYYYMGNGTYPLAIGKKLKSYHFEKRYRDLHVNRLNERFFPWYTGKKKKNILTKNKNIKVINLRECIRRDEITLEESLEMFDKDLPDLSMIYLRSVDIASHFYWKYSQLPKSDSRLDGLETEIERFQDTIPEVYRWADECVGKIVEKFPSDTMFILVSDHGFMTLFNDLRGYNLMALMMDRGWAHYPKDGRLLPVAMDTADTIDMVRRIYLQEDRVAEYSLETGEPREQILDNLLTNLKSLRTRSGKALLTHVPSDTINLLNNEAPPDLAMRFNAKLTPDDVIVFPDGDVSIEKYIQFLEMSGNHKNTAVIIVSGPNVRKGIEIKNARTLDITPTLLTLFDLPVGADMDGVPLLELFEPEFSKTHFQTVIDTYEDKIVREIREVSDSSRPKILEELKAIGYIQ